MSFVKKGFTMVEMLIVVFIIAALVAIFSPVQSYIVKDTTAKSMQANAKGLTTASAEYLAEFKALPVTTDPVTVTDENVLRVIKSELKKNGLREDLIGSLNGTHFKEIDVKAISSYIKGDKSNVGDFFIVDKVDNLPDYNNELMGQIFTAKAYKTDGGIWYSGLYTYQFDPNAPTECVEPWLSQGYTCVGKPSEFNDIRNHVGDPNAKFVLVNDIDLSEYSSWEPIGDWVSYSDFTKAFQGIFDGNGHTIKNVTIHQNKDSGYGWGVGIFGIAYESTIKNVNLDNVTIDPVSVPTYAGSLVGFNYGSAQSKKVISNVHAKNIVITAGSQWVGGVIGKTYIPVTNSTIENVTMTGIGGDKSGGFVGSAYTMSNITAISGSITSSSTRVGGVAGSLEGYTSTNLVSHISVKGRGMVGGVVGDNGATLKKSHATGRVEGTITSESSMSSTGGLVGDNSGTIQFSYATGEVFGNTKTGGLVGRMRLGNILNSYSTATVTANGSYAVAAGLVGETVGVSVSKKIENSYATGIVSGNNITAGLIGVQSVDDPSYAYVTVLSSYYDMDKTGQTTSAAGEGKTTTEMKQQATFTGWDFTNIWSIDENVSYPTIR